MRPEEEVRAARDAVRALEPTDRWMLDEIGGVVAAQHALDWILEEDETPPAEHRVRPAILASDRDPRADAERERLRRFLLHRAWSTVRALRRADPGREKLADDLEAALRDYELAVAGATPGPLGPVSRLRSGLQDRLELSLPNPAQRAAWLASRGVEWDPFSTSRPLDHVEDEDLLARIAEDLSHRELLRGGAA